MLHRVEATVRPENAASRAVLTKVGFREEGLLRRYSRWTARGAITCWWRSPSRSSTARQRRHWCERATRPGPSATCAQRKGPNLRRVAGLLPLFASRRLVTDVTFVTDGACQP